MESSAWVTSEDGKRLHPGDRAFNYYDMTWGIIGNDIDSEGWFTFHGDDGSRHSLNGSRIATYDPRGA